METLRQYAKYLSLIRCGRFHRAIKDFADIEEMFILHGGGRKQLEQEARELAKTTPMTFKQAVSHVLAKDEIRRNPPVGFLSFGESPLAKAQEAILKLETKV